MQRIFTKNLIIAIISIAFMAAAHLIAIPSNAAANPVKAPDFTLLNLNGDLVRLSHFKGKVVLVNFFATYCPPCRYEIPDFVKLQKELGEDRFQVIGISVDDNAQKILPRFVQYLKINYPVLVATSKVLKDFGNVYYLPQTFLISKDQKIIKHYQGMITEDDIKPLIMQALGPEEKQK